MSAWHVPDNIRRTAFFVLHSAFYILHSAFGISIAHAEETKLPIVESVRVGLPTAVPTTSSDADLGRTRRGAGAPVYVRIKAGSEAIAPDSLRLIAEANDGEGAAYRYATPLPGVAADNELFAITYIHPGEAEVAVSLQTVDGKTVPVLVRTADGRTVTASRVTREFGHEVLEPTHTLYLALGSRLSGLHHSILSNDASPLDLSDENLSEDRSPRKLAFLENVRDLPDRWFGYEAADIVVLATSNETFLKQLLAPSAAPQRKALGEWIRRGGKLIVAVGHNRQLVAELLDHMSLPEFDKQPLLNCKIEGGVTRKVMHVLTRWATVSRDLPPQLQGVELTVFRPNARQDAGPRSEPVNVLIRETPEDNDRGLPVVMHTACGLGRVVVVGFDFDVPPFSTWTGQKAFWDKLEAELQPRLTLVKKEERSFAGSRSLELAEELKGSLESFQEIPVISFGWVALLILGYIVIIGPLDYLILKKVFRRLELTWVTFPTVVLAASIATYFTAHSLKGDDLRINKIDVLDFDLHGTTPQAYGTTWVTLFSPRIDNYTIGVEPATPAWTDAPTQGPATHSVVMSVLEKPDVSSGDMGSQGTFRQPYLYATDAAGLENVSIPMWATKTFTARWRGSVTPGKALIEAELHHSRDKNDPSLLGRVVNRLPVELRDVTLLYNGRQYSAGTLAPDSFLPIDNLSVGGQGKQAVQWLNEIAALSSNSGRIVTGPELIKDFLFHGPPAQSAKSNSGWHDLDQSWRLRPLVETSSRPQPQSVYRDEVLLVARVSSQAGPAENVTRADASPTRLWLGKLPGTGTERPILNGYIVQDVYLRVYIPVSQ